MPHFLIPPYLLTHIHYNLFTVHLHVSYFLAKSFIVRHIYQAAHSSSRPSNVTYISSTCDIKLSFLTWRIQSCIYMYVQLGYLFILAIVDIHVQKLLYSWEVYSILCLYWNMVIPQSLKSANILAVSMWDNILQTWIPTIIISCCTCQLFSSSPSLSSIIIQTTLYPLLSVFPPPESTSTTLFSALGMGKKSPPSLNSCSGHSPVCKGRVNKQK